VIADLEILAVLQADQAVGTVVLVVCNFILVIGLFDNVTHGIVFPGQGLAVAAVAAAPIADSTSYTES